MMSKLQDEYEAAVEEQRRKRRIRKQRQRERRVEAARMSGREVRRNSHVTGRSEFRCKAKVRTSGEPCPMYRCLLEDPETGKMYRAATCYAHLPDKVRERFDKPKLGGEPGKRGVPPKPKLPEVMRKMVEEDASIWLQPYFDALKAMKPLVVGNGMHARVEMVPDMRARQQAAEAVLDRLFGKAIAKQEISGPAGGPVEVNVPNDAERQKAVAQILAQAGAIPDQQQKVAKVAAAARGADRN